MESTLFNSLKFGSAHRIHIYPLLCLQSGMSDFLVNLLGSCRRPPTTLESMHTMRGTSWILVASFWIQYFVWCWISNFQKLPKLIIEFIAWKFEFGNYGIGNWVLACSRCRRHVGQITCHELIRCICVCVQSATCTDRSSDTGILNVVWFLMKLSVFVCRVAYKNNGNACVTCVYEFDAPEDILASTGSELVPEEPVGAFNKLHDRFPRLGCNISNTL